MKKVLALILAVMMVFSITACGNDASETSSVSEKTPETIGEKLLYDFENQLKADPSLNAQALADALLANEVIQFSGASVPVEAGLLTGFDNAEITGFSEGVMFAPMIGTIPFIGYVFVLEDGTDVAAFETLLKDNANPRWNICTEAEETVVGSVDNKVFFVMCPKSFETEAEAE